MTFFRGPVGSLGPLIGGGDSINDGPYDGPNISYQGNCVPDPRYSPANKDGQGSGRIPCFLNQLDVVLSDNIPSTASTTGLAAAQAVTAATPMTLTTVAPGGGASAVPSLGTSVPILPFGTVTPVNVLALDFGFTTGTTVAASATVTVPDSTLFEVGQWICISGAGNSAKTASLLTQVLTLATATTITVFPVPTGALSFAPIGSANLLSTFPSGAVPNAASPYVNGGVASIFNPIEGLARNVAIAANAGASGNACLVSGYDVFGVPMSETITAVAASTVWGKKAFKYIASIVPGTTDAGHTLSAGWGDTFGFNLRADRWAYTEVVYNGVIVPTSVGFTGAVAAASGDVRGTIQVSANGAGTPITAAAATNGVIRLTMMISVPAWNLLNGSPANTVPLLGATQT
jgi:hypothetical protein